MAITRIEGEYGNKLKVNPNGSIDATVTGMDMSGAKISIDELKVREVWEGSETVTKTFITPASAVSVVNDGAENLVITVNAMNITVKPDEGFESIFVPFTTLKIAATGAYRALVKG